MVGCMTWTEHSFWTCTECMVCFYKLCIFIFSLCLFSSYPSAFAWSGSSTTCLCSFSKSVEIFLLFFLVTFVILWRNPILIKICSVFSFLISLVADPSFPLYLIVSCGKFLSFQGFLNYCLSFLLSRNK